MDANASIISAEGNLAVSSDRTPVTANDAAKSQLIPGGLL
jgi:hypothetical protein